jgi:hypothetical protein
MSTDLNIQKNFGKYDKIPVCNTIKKILIGKLFYFNVHAKYPFVILALRRNSLYGHLEMLIGTYNGYSISVYSWYSYHRTNMSFVGRGKREAIRKCLKTNPKYISYHLGKSVDLSLAYLYETPPLGCLNGKLAIYENYTQYYRATL